MTPQEAASGPTAVSFSTKPFVTVSVPLTYGKSSAASFASLALRLLAVDEPEQRSRRPDRRDRVRVAGLHHWTRRRPGEPYVHPARLRATD